MIQINDYDYPCRFHNGLRTHLKSRPCLELLEVRPEELGFTQLEACHWTCPPHDKLHAPDSIGFEVRLRCIPLSAPTWVIRIHTPGEDDPECLYRGIIPSTEFLRYLLRLLLFGEYEELLSGYMGLGG
jgi:hypothetical protein